MIPMTFILISLLSRSADAMAESAKKESGHQQTICIGSHEADCYAFTKEPTGERRLGFIHRGRVILDRKLSQEWWTKIDRTIDEYSRRKSVEAECPTKVVVEELEDGAVQSLRQYCFERARFAWIRDVLKNGVGGFPTKKDGLSSKKSGDL